MANGYEGLDSEEENESEYVHVAENEAGAIHKEEKMISLELYERGIILIFTETEWTQFKQLMWEALKHDKR